MDAPTTVLPEQGLRFVVIIAENRCFESACDVDGTHGGFPSERPEAPEEGDQEQDDDVCHGERGAPQVEADGVSRHRHDLNCLYRLYVVVDQ